MRIHYIFLLFILPIIGNSQENIIILQPGEEGKDALLWSIEPNSNYGNLSKFLCMAWTFGGTQGIDRSLIHFDLVNVPAGKIIKKAKLSLYYKDLEPNITYHTGDNKSSLRLITKPWDEQTVTWNNAPPTDTAFQVFLPKSISPQQDYLDIDVTALIAQIYNNPDQYHGIELRLVNEQPFTCLLFASSDIEQASLRPRLEIVLNESTELTALFDYESLGDRGFIFNNLSTGYTRLDWSFGDGFSSNEENPFHVYLNDGVHNVCLTASNNTDQKSYCTDIYVCHNIVHTDFTHETRGLVCSFINEAINADIYNWDFGDGQSSQIMNPTHTYNTSGIFNVKLVALNNCSSEEVTKTITVYPNIFEPNLESDWVTIYPNPSYGDLNILTNNTGILYLEIFEMSGKFVKWDYIRTTESIPVVYKVKLMSGAYEFRIWINNRMIRKKIIILHV